MTNVAPITQFVPRKASKGLDPLAIVALGLLAVFAAAVFMRTKPGTDQDDVQRPAGFGF